MHECKVEKKYWLKRNLNVENFLNGDIIPEAQSPGAWQIAAEYAMPAWCYFNNDMSNAPLGKLYNWYALNDPRGLAPKGWHIPSDKDWTMLFMNTGSLQEDFQKIGVTQLFSDKDLARFLFSQQSIGIRSEDGLFQRESNSLQLWWSSTHFDADKAIVRGFDTSLHQPHKMYWEKGVGLFVRCVREIGEGLTL